MKSNFIALFSGLKIHTFLVTEPMVVNIVSKLIVSEENCSFMELSFEYFSSSKQEVKQIRHKTIIDIDIKKTFFIIQKKLHYKDISNN